MRPRNWNMSGFKYGKKHVFIAESGILLIIIWGIQQENEPPGASFHTCNIRDLEHAIRRRYFRFVWKLGFVIVLPDDTGGGGGSPYFVPKYHSRRIGVIPIPFYLTMRGAHFAHRDLTFVCTHYQLNGIRHVSGRRNWGILYVQSRKITTYSNCTSRI